MGKLNYEALGKYLEALARQQSLKSYSDIVDQFGLPPLDGAWKSHPLCAAFEYLDRADATHGRPFRTALVVRKSDVSSRTPQLPGDGFFESLEKFKAGQGPIAPKDRDAVWVRELTAVHAYPWPLQ